MCPFAHADIATCVGLCLRLHHVVLPEWNAVKTMIKAIHDEKEQAISIYACMIQSRTIVALKIIQMLLNLTC